MSKEHLTRDLMERAQAGDDEAFTLLWDRYWPRLLAWADGKINRRLQSRLDAEDILQTVFRTFYRHLPSGRYVIEERGRLWVLLLGIARNKICQRRERETAQKRDFEQERPLSAVLMAVLSSGEPDTKLSLELREEVECVLQTLSPLDAEIARLGIWDQCSLREIAQTTGATLASVRLVMGRVTELLRSRLAD